MAPPLPASCLPASARAGARASAPPAAASAPASLDALLAALFARTHGGMRYDLTAMHALLSALGQPQRAFRVVSVAGTNGKGATSALVAATLQAADVRTGLFTSPHLTAFNERIRIDGQPLADADVARLYARLLAAEPRLPRPFSFFEACVAMACLAYAEVGVEVAVLEAGLGGRLDATNVFAAKELALCLLSRVDLDHQAILGATVQAIAGEKAGLWRAGRPVVAGLQAPAVAETLAQRARQLGAPLRQLTAADVAACVAAVPAIATWPGYMQQNAALARQGCLHLATVMPRGLPLTPAHFAQACAGFVWPGRYHWWRAPGDRGPTVLLDGGHNPAGCQALATALAREPRLRGRRLHGLVSALRDKDLTAMVAPLAAVLGRVALCSTHAARARDVTTLRRDWPGHAVFPDSQAAFAALLQGMDDADVLVVTGSLTLVGEAMQQLRARHFVDAGMGGQAGPTKAI